LSRHSRVRLLTRPPARPHARPCVCFPAAVRHLEPRQPVLLHSVTTVSAIVAPTPMTATTPRDPGGGRPPAEENSPATVAGLTRMSWPTPPERSTRTHAKPMPAGRARDLPRLRVSSQPRGTGGALRAASVAAQPRAPLAEAKPEGDGHPRGEDGDGNEESAPADTAVEEEILGSRRHQNQLQYRAKWTSSHGQDKTWRPASNFETRPTPYNASTSAIQRSHHLRISNVSARLSHRHLRRHQSQVGPYRPGRRRAKGSLQRAAFARTADGKQTTHTSPQSS